MQKIFCCIFLSFIFVSSNAQLDFDTFTQQRDSVLQLKVGTSFPDFLVTNTNGDTFSGQDLKGKITVINFWFESCSPCIAEIGALNRLFLKFKDNPDFRFLSFTTDSFETAKKAMEKFGILFNVCQTTKKECERLFCAGFPTNIIVNQEGKVAYIKAGVYPNGTQVSQMELLTAFLLIENNRTNPYLYSVSASIRSDTLGFPKLQTTGDLIRMGLWKKYEEEESVVGLKYMDFAATTIQGKRISHEQLAGKITVIDIWKQDCEPCIAAFEFF